MSQTKKELIPLEEQLVFPLYLCAKEVIRIYSVFLKEIDLTYTQFVVMLYFWEKKVSNVKEIGKTMLLDSSTLTPLLKKLEKKGLISRKKSTVDERNLVLELTKKGMALKEKALPIPVKMQKLCGLSESEEKALRKSIVKLLQNTEREMNKDGK